MKIATGVTFIVLMTMQSTLAQGALLECGKASWYGKPFAGKPTASGEAFDPSLMTAAHRRLPFGTRVRVTRSDTKKSIIVRINDRGPFVPGRIIDVSEKAANTLAFKKKGVTQVCIRRLDEDGD